MRMLLRSGRPFDADEMAEGNGAVIVNETLARSLWPGEDAVGKKFGGRIRRDAQQFHVVGVVGDIRDFGYDQQIRPTFYRPCHELQLTGQRPFFVLRTQNDPRPLVSAIHRELKAAEPAMGMPQIVVSRDVLEQSTQARRTFMRYLAAFAAAGLMLSTLGIYGVLAYSVTRRTQEIGIRLALGAGRRQVLNLILADGARLLATGAVVGLIASFWLTRLVQHQLFEVRPTEPLVFSGALVLLGAVGLLACFFPARRATQVDPVVALRTE
jgi:predicted lysophospholipase L1 biosynthesis ABC-type transport system permease subunit